MQYQVNRFDVCSEGSENLRNRDEFLIVADVFIGVTSKDLLDMLFYDVQCCEREEDFDYAACKAAIQDWFDVQIQPRLANSFGLAENDGECKLFVYMQAVENETIDA
jgi:hypothetical protein